MLGSKQNTLNKSLDFGGHFGHEVDEYKFNYMQWLSPWDLCEQFVATVLYCIDKLSKFIRFWTQIRELNSGHKFVLGFYVSIIAHMNFCSIYNFVLYKPFCAWEIINYPLFVGLWIIFLSDFKNFCTSILKTLLAVVRYPKTCCEWSFIFGLLCNFDIAINLIPKRFLLCEIFDRCTQLD